MTTFLASETLASQIIPDKAKEDLSQINMLSVLDGISLAERLFLLSDQEFDKSGQTPSETSFNEKGVEQLKAALSEINTIRKIDTKVIGEVDAKIATEEFKKQVDTVKSNLFEQMVALNYSSVELQESLGVWDQYSDIAMSKGLIGLVDELEITTNKLLDLRIQPERGRDYSTTSLPRWKIIAIAALVGVAILTVIACFIWSACAWILTVVKEIYLPILLALLKS